MERLALLSLVILCALAPTFVRAQDAWQDDGLIWIALTLIDQDAPGGPVSLNDSFLEPCTVSSPHALADWMPNGFRQDRAEHQRALQRGECERIVALRLRGHIDWTPVRMTIPWQPGQNATRAIGIPRSGAGALTLRLPDVLVVGAQAYQVPEPVVVTVGPSERSTSVLVPLRRLARAIIYEPVDEVTLDRYTIPHDVTTHFLLPGERLLQTDAKHRLRVVAVDQQGRRHSLTDPRAPQRFVNLSATYGWTFEVEVLPRERTHRDWVASLRTAGT